MTRAFATLDLRPLSAIVGVELGQAPLLDVAVDVLWSALDQHALLLVRDQPPSPEALIALTRRFGQPERFDSSRADSRFPEVCIVTNDQRQASAQPVYWHSDGAQQPQPPPLSLFYAARVPTSGGETLFADARQAYDELPEALHQQIEGRRAILPSGLEQPLVRVHPRTARRALYIDFGQTVGITGLDRPDAAVLLKALRDHVARPDATYAHRWAAGDLAIWDNAAVLHSATSPNATAGRRLMWRTTVRGDVVTAG